MVGAMNDVLLDNQLAFLRHHRGHITTTEGGYTVQSARPEFTYAIALRDAVLDPALAVVHRPEHSAAPVSRLEAAGFRRIAAVRTMTRPVGSAALVPAAIPVDVVTDLAGADTFSDVQTRGFFDREEDQREWSPFMRDAARRNVGAKDQAFFLARCDGEPAGVTLTVSTEVVGVYAVATPRAFRRRGIATALLEAALGHAAAAGSRLATLQVAVGSDAERLYTRLGFEPAFVTDVWRRA